MKPLLRRPTGVSTLLDQPRLARILVGVALILLVGAALPLPLWPCPWLALTGQPCPGCGLTRAALAAGRGQWGRSWQLNPLAAPLLAYGLAVAAGLVGTRAWQVGYRRRWRRIERRLPWTWAFLALVLWFQLTRMA